MLVHQENQEDAETSNSHQGRLVRMSSTDQTRQLVPSEYEYRILRHRGPVAIADDRTRRLSMTVACICLRLVNLIIVAAYVGLVERCVEYDTIIIKIDLGTGCHRISLIMGKFVLEADSVDGLRLHLTRPTNGDIIMRLVRQRGHGSAIVEEKRWR